MVYLFLANGFEEIEALTPLDLLRRAGVKVMTVGVGGGELITGAHGIAVRPDMIDTDFDDATPEMIILPGGMPGAKNLDVSPVVKTALQNANACGGILSAICAAPMVLGHLGYLRGKRAVCFPGFEGELLGAIVTKSRIEHDGNVVTSIGMGSALEFGLELVSCLCGEKKSVELAKSILAKI